MADEETMRKDMLTPSEVIERDRAYRIWVNAGRPKDAFARTLLEELDKEHEDEEEAAPDFTDLGDFEAVALKLIPDLVHEDTDGIHWKRMRSRFMARDRFAGVDTLLPGEWLNNLNNIRDNLNAEFEGAPDCQDDTPECDIEHGPTKEQKDLREFLRIAKGPFVPNLFAFTYDYVLKHVRDLLTQTEEAACDGTPHPDDDEGKPPFDEDDPKPSYVKVARDTAQRLDRLHRGDSKIVYSPKDGEGPGVPNGPKAKAHVVDEILGTILREHVRARGLYGDADDKNTPSDWIAFISGYVSRCGEVPFNEVTYIQNLTKTAALCVSAMVAYTKHGLVPRHYDDVATNVSVVFGADVTDKLRGDFVKTFNEFLGKKGVKILSQKEVED